jgi:hypothetical protein
MLVALHLLWNVLLLHELQCYQIFRKNSTNPIHHAGGPVSTKVNVRSELLEHDESIVALLDSVEDASDEMV